MKFSKFLEESSQADAENVQYYKELINQIAHDIEDQEFRISTKYKTKVTDRLSGDKRGSILQQLASTYLFSELSAEDLVKKYKISSIEAYAILDFLNHKYYWYRDEKIWYKDAMKNDPKYKFIRLN